MIVPKQTGTADSCTTKSEEEIFYYQDQHNLITLGWIHVCFQSMYSHIHTYIHLKLYLMT